MARDGSGNYSNPVTLVAGTAATAANVNSNFSDIATALTQSLAIDGQTVMTGQLPAASGTLANPGYSFAGDLNTGRYRTGADAFSDVCGGAVVVAYSTTGVSVTGDVTVSGKISGAQGTIPVGALMPYGGSSDPTGWLICAGQAVSRTTYAALFAVIGTSYGMGDGSTTFGIPDLRGRVPTGKDNMGSADASRLSTLSTAAVTLGGTGGSQTHQLTVAQMPSHNHGTNTSTDGAHEHAYTAPLNVNTDTAIGGASNRVTSTGVVNSSTAGSHSHTISSQGGDGAHNNIQPILIVNYIIYAGV